MLYMCLGGNLGPAIFSVKGNQCEAWKPAVVRYTGTAAIQVNADNCLKIYKGF